MKAIILSPISLVFCILLNVCCNSIKFSMMDEMIDTSENISMTLLKNRYNNIERLFNYLCGYQ